MLFGNALRSMRLYPAYNPIPMSAVERMLKMLEEILESQGELQLKFTKKACFFDDKPIKGTEDEMVKIISLANEIYNHSISSIIFFEKITKEELLDFLNILLKEPAELFDSGGASALLKQHEVSRILVTEIPRKVSFSETTEPVEIEKAALDMEQRIISLIESIIFKETLTDKEERLLFHILSKPGDLKIILDHIAAGGESKEPFSLRLLEKAALALMQIIERKSQQYSGLEQNLIQAILMLNEKISSNLLVSLVYTSLRNPIAKKLIQNVQPETVGGLIMRAHEDGDAQVERLAPVVARLDLEEEFKEKLIEIFRNGLSRKGYSEEEINLLFEPSSEEKQKLGEDIESFSEEQRETRKSLPEIMPEETILQSKDVKLIEFLRNEANQYKANDHISSALFSLLKLVSEESSLKNLKKAIFQFLPKVASQGNFAVLSKVMTYLNELSRMNNLKEDVKKVANEVVKELSMKKYTLQALEVMMNNDPSTSAYNKAFQFINTLPKEETIGAVLESLAMEELLSRRKLLLSIICSLSADSIDILAKRISDPRWYLVRNIVTIFAMIGKKEAVQYLAETLRHSDKRVIKESVKALGIIGGPDSFEMLNDALAGKDSELKNLIIRSIGQTRDPRAIEVIRPIALKKDFFFRDLQTKLSAIEALSKIHTEESISILQRLSQTRNLFFPRKAKVLANAARSALEIALAKKKDVDGIELLKGKD